MDLFWTYSVGPTWRRGTRSRLVDLPVRKVPNTYGPEGNNLFTSTSIKFYRTLPPKPPIFLGKICVQAEKRQFTEIGVDRLPHLCLPHKVVTMSFAQCMRPPRLRALDRRCAAALFPSRTLSAAAAKEETAGAATPKGRGRGRTRKRSFERRHLRLEYGMRMDVQGQLDDERVRSRALERERDEAIRRADWADTERRAARRREMAQHQENDARLADGKMLAQVQSAPLS